MSALLSNLDIGRGILAILLSVALFSVVQNDRNPTESRTIDAAADLVGVPPGLIVFGEPSARSVQVQVTAPREIWNTLRPSSLRATVDLTSATPGLSEFPVRAARADATDSRVRVLEVVPARITVQLEERIERDVPVRINRTGNVPFGYQATDVEVDPPTVNVSGPAAVVRRVENAVVDVRLEGVTVDVDGRYTTFPVDAQGQPITVEGRQTQITPAAVRVRIPISQQLSYKTVGVQPNLTGSVLSGFSVEGVSVEPSAVTVVGSPRSLAALNAAETERIDVTDAGSTFTRQTAIVVPEGVSVVQPDPIRVTVRISSISITQAFTTVPIPEQLQPELQIAAALPSIQVVLQGPAGSVRSEPQATLNLSGLGAGTHQITVEVSPPPGTTVSTVNPRVVSVSLVDVSAPPVVTSTPSVVDVAPLPTATPEPSPSPASPTVTPSVTPTSFPQ